MAAEVKHSYTIPCPSTFRDAALALADQRRVNVADLARSVMLVVPAPEIEAFPDPGEPPPGDREIVVLKSGPSAGRPWRRKPRLQVRMATGYTVPFVRQALAIALALATGDVVVSVGNGAPLERPPPPPRPDPALVAEIELLRTEVEVLRRERDKLASMVPLLVGDPLPGGVGTRQDALYVMGFAPGSWPDAAQVRSRFRHLATILHPDSGLGDHDRMSQLNQAMSVLREQGERPRVT
ncbi:molecular chaperone DnaJ [Pararhodospirillum photometricum]|nr:molecular chaperone DnaJ [Pararhodospirillum photometricum]